MADAHATLVRTDPRSGGVVPAAPGQVSLRFDQQVTPVAGGSDVVDESGSSVMAGAARTSPTDAATVVLPLRPNLPDGDYTVRWGIVSSDGHLISGVFAFGVGEGRGPPQAVGASGGTEQDWRYLTARAVYFAGLLLLIGGTVFRLAVFLPSLGTAPDGGRRMMGLRERHRANQVLAVTAAMALAGGWVALTLQGAAVAGVSFWEAFDHRGPVGSAIEATRFGRQFGRGIDVTALLTVLVAIAYAVAPHSRRMAVALAGPAAALGLWALAVPGISGHAGDPGRGALAVALDAAHVAAAAVWVGGLLQLAWVVPHATRGLPDADRTRVRSAIARRFSRIALWSVAVLVVTGVCRSLFELETVSQLWSTSYGRVLLGKVAVLALLVMLGYRNRRILDRFRELRRSVVVELGLLAVVVGLVALLTNLPPGTSPAAAGAAGAAPRGGIATLPVRGGGRLTVWPGHAGTNVFALRMPGLRGGATLMLQRPDGSGSEQPLERRADGTYTLLAQDVPAGSLVAQISAGAHTWAATVQIGAASVTPGVPASPAPAGPVAAGQAADLAVGLQRLPADRVRVTVLAADGSAVRNALITVNGRVALPCTGPEVCYQVRPPRGATALDVEVGRAGRPPVTAAVDLPPAGSPTAAALVRRTARALRRAGSLIAVQHLASDPVHRVVSRFVVNAPDRLEIHVEDGLDSVIIGDRRWDRPPGEDWQRSKARPVTVPDPFWAQRPVAAYVAGQTARTVDVTLAYDNGSPTWFRLHIQRATGRVLEVHMITAAHFMTEAYTRFGSAPVVRPPAL